jgi:general secretion pathway protein D
MPRSIGAFYRILGRDVNATLHALSSVSKTEILSRPSILTRNNQQATIMVGQSVPIITNSRVVDQTNSHDQHRAVSGCRHHPARDAVHHRRRPGGDDRVARNLLPERDHGADLEHVSSPVIDKRSADTVVVTPSDRTVVIGGLISTEVKDLDSKVPILGDIPLLGYAFKRKQKSTTKTELLIFLTPRVIQNPATSRRPPTANGRKWTWPRKPSRRRSSNAHRQALRGDHEIPETHEIRVSGFVYFVCFVV